MKVHHSKVWYLWLKWWPLKEDHQMYCSKLEGEWERNIYSIGWLITSVTECVSHIINECAGHLFTSRFSFSLTQIAAILRFYSFPDSKSFFGNNIIKRWATVDGWKMFFGHWIRVKSRENVEWMNIYRRWEITEWKMRNEKEKREMTKKSSFERCCMKFLLVSLTNHFLLPNSSSPHLSPHSSFFCTFNSFHQSLFTFVKREIKRKGIKRQGMKNEVFQNVNELLLFRMRKEL